MRAAQNVWLPFLLLVLVACVPPLRPASLDERIAEAVMTVDNLYVTAIQARRAGAIDDDTALRLDPLLNDAWSAAHAASVFLGASDPAAAQTKLELADELIWKIQGMLNKEASP